MLSSVGQKLGKRASIESYTEVVFKGQRIEANDRPDGLIVVRVGTREWRALVEAKIGNNELAEDQVERYRTLAKDHNIDCLITVSNQFATAPQNHPLVDVRKSRSKIPVYHWSWMAILTTADLLLNNDAVQDSDQMHLLNELRRFLSHESAGVKGFDRMPSEWAELNRLVSAGGRIPGKSTEAQIVLDAWHQETRDLALILSRQTETPVTEKLPRKYLNKPTERLKDELKELRENNCLAACLEIPNAAAPIEIVADLSRRTIIVGMSLRAPEDKKSSKARVNWLIRQVKSNKLDDLYVRLNWPGRSDPTQHPYTDIAADPSIVERDKSGLQVLSFQLYFAKRLGGRFTQQTNFIVDLETVVPQFYREIGQNLVAWRKAPPKIQSDKDTAEQVTVEAISELADEADGG